tara:strand:- start:10773 stop:11717 length:945 start_codon:yes stop_codon:yes gene_type:complete
MASGKNRHLAEKETPANVDGEPLRTLKAPRNRKAGEENELDRSDPTFKVEFAKPEPASNRGSSVGMMLALAVLLLAVCYLIFVLSRSESGAPEVAELPPNPSAEAGATSVPKSETAAVALADLEQKAPQPADVTEVIAKMEAGVEDPVSSTAMVEQKSVSSLELKRQLDPIEALLDYSQFGDSVRYLFSLERKFPNAQDTLKQEIQFVLKAWLDSSKAPTVHDQEIIAILAERGFDQETMNLVFRGAEEMPEDAVWMRAAAARGHVDSMARLAGWLYQRNPKSADAELWYRKAALSGNEEAINWCRSLGIEFSD